MNSAAGQFIDANVLMYSMGGPHPLRSPCKEILRKIKEGRVKAVTNTHAYPVNAELSVPPGFVCVLASSYKAL